MPDLRESIDLRDPAGPPKAAAPTDPEVRYRHWCPPPLEPGWALHDLTSGPLYLEGERFLYQVYRDSGFCTESRREIVEELDPWRHMGVLHVLTNGGEVIGVVRTTAGVFTDLPISQFTTSEEPPAGLLVEIGSLAVEASLRSQGAGNELERIAIRRGAQLGAEAFVFEIDPWLYELCTKVMAFPIRQIAPQHRYMGGDVIPSMMYVGELLHSLADRRPDFYRWMTRDYSPEMLDRYSAPILLP